MFDFIISLIKDTISFLIKNKRQIKEKAHDFICENENDLDFLPLCLVKDSIKSAPFLNEILKKESHSIYGKYIRLSNPVKKQVLKQEKINFELPKNSNWLREYLTYLENDAKKFELIGKDSHHYLYDYSTLRTAMRSIYQSKLPNLIAIPFQDVPVIVSSRLFSNTKPNYEAYVTEAIYKHEENNSKLKDAAEPPLDFADANCDDDIKKFLLCITQTAFLLSDHLRFNSKNPNKFLIENSKIPVETYEDYFYKTILNLYFAYSNATYKEKLLHVFRTQ